MLDVLTISRPDQLKALGHPLRLRVLETLGTDDDEEELTNRELAQRLGVDPGHLHFHVRMLLKAGLIELADNGKRGREKPYRAVARVFRVAPELLASGGAKDVQAAMIDQVQRGWAEFARSGRFRSAQLNVRLKPEDVRELFRQFVEAAEEREDEANEPLLITFFSHPHPSQAE